MRLNVPIVGFLIGMLLPLLGFAVVYALLIVLIMFVW